MGAHVPIEMTSNSNDCHELKRGATVVTETGKPRKRPRKFSEAPGKKKRETLL